MLRNLLVGGGVMAVCVVIHATGVAAAVQWLRKRPFPAGWWSWTVLFIGVAAWIVLLHLIEIVAWAVLYVWLEAMADLQSGVYFSAVTYTTTGYGDLVLPERWRLLGAIEALTGILMCGWSTGFLFAVVSKMFITERTTAGPTI